MIGETLHVPYAGSMTGVSISSVCTQIHRAWKQAGETASLCALAELLRVTKTWWDSSHNRVLPWIGGWIQAGEQGQRMQRRGGRAQCLALEWVLSLLALKREIRGQNNISNVVVGICCRPSGQNEVDEAFK